jgi:uncharacterized protein YaeQ
MALTPTRMEFRIALSNVDRGVERQEAVIIGMHPSETPEHLMLRVLAWCLLTEERLEFGPGLSTPDSPDLWTHDLTGVLTCWIECGSADVEALRKIVQKNSQAQVHAVFGDLRRRDELRDAIAASGRKGLDRIQLWMIDEQLVRALAARHERRQRWSVTVVGDHFYIDADGTSFDGEVTRS